jgi:hypothetical protein
LSHAATLQKTIGGCGIVNVKTIVGENGIPESCATVRHGSLVTFLHAFAMTAMGFSPLN